MATAETTTAVAYRELDLPEFVQNATWREVLIDLVATNRLDPWDIDLVKVVDGYLAAIRRMKVLELRIPANIILAASILLRMKSDTISIFSMVEEELPPDGDSIAAERVRPDVEQLVPRARMQPNRKVTLNELLDALNGAMKMEEKRMVEHEREIAPVSFAIDKVDIEDKMERVHLAIKESLDKEGLTTFGTIAKGYTSPADILLDLFVPVLFLAHDGKITVMQERFFDEIFIKLLDGVKVEGRARAGEARAA